MLNPNSTTLYRPVGMAELRLIFESGMTRFPPRLSEQPIFYPVLNFEYARQIAFTWNTQSAPYAGYVTEFDVDSVYCGQFEKHIVGSRIHEELWVPAEELDEFNRHIIGPIRVVDADFGPEFTGCPAETGPLRGLDAFAQLTALKTILTENPLAFDEEIRNNLLVIFLNYPFWVKLVTAPGEFTEERYRDVIALIKRMNNG